MNDSMIPKGWSATDIGIPAEENPIRLPDQFRVGEKIPLDQRLKAQEPRSAPVDGLRHENCESELGLNKWMDLPPSTGFTTLHAVVAGEYCSLEWK